MRQGLYYELEIDQRLGVLLAVTAVRSGLAFHKMTTLGIQFGQPIPDSTFRFEPPAGEEIEPRNGAHRVVEVTLVEAQQQTPFTVLMPDTVPTSWQARCRLIRASTRPPSPMQIGLRYDSVDGHESVSLTQAAAEASDLNQQIDDEEDWEHMTRGGIAMRTRPVQWGQAQVELEQRGTSAHLMSDNLTRDQLLTLAAGLRPAPSTSSI